MPMLRLCSIRLSMARPSVSHLLRHFMDARRQRPRACSGVAVAREASQGARLLQRCDLAAHQGHQRRLRRTRFIGSCLAASHPATAATGSPAGVHRQRGAQLRSRGAPLVVQEAALPQAAPQLRYLLLQARRLGRGSGVARWQGQTPARERRILLGGDSSA
jgi:hypothetical protein